MFEIEGSGFLYKMVRLMVGALIHIGRGSLDEGGLRALLDCRLDARGEIIKSPLCAGADGLYMVEVFYAAPPCPAVPLTSGVYLFPWVVNGYKHTGKSPR